MKDIDIIMHKFHDKKRRMEYRKIKGILNVKESLEQVSSDESSSYSESLSSQLSSKNITKEYSNMLKELNLSAIKSKDYLFENSLVLK